MRKTDVNIFTFSTISFFSNLVFLRSVNMNVLGYLQGRDCCDHDKPIKIHTRITIKNTACYNFTDGILVRRHVVFLAYLLNKHSNPELARTLVNKFRDKLQQD